MLKMLGFFVPVFFIFGCGKKGDPVPLYKQPLFSASEEKKPSLTPKDQTSKKNEKKDTESP
jgi:hypothetical protein